MGKIKKKLGLCDTKGCFRVASTEIELKGVTEDGEEEVLETKKLCKRCTMKLLKSTMPHMFDLSID